MSITSRSRARLVATTLLVAVGLVLALGTSVTAAALITGSQIKDGSLSGRDVRDSALTSRDVRDGSLTPADYVGPVVGPRGPEGAAGPVGPRGTPGITGLSYPVSEPVRVTSRAAGGATATCPAGAWPTAGGFATRGNPSNVFIWESAPEPAGDRWGWRTFVSNEGDATIVGYAWAVCALTR